jgi:hypothetical protein
MEHRRRLQGEEPDTQIRPVDDLSSATVNSAGPLDVWRDFGVIAVRALTGLKRIDWLGTPFFVRPA